jgi:hypothetical protein
MDENLENDSQDVQPTTNEHESDAPSESNELEVLRQELAVKEERISHLASQTRAAKKEAKEAKELKSDSEPKKTGLDYGQLAFHNTKAEAVKIEHQEDIDFLTNTLEETGKDQASILNSNWFKSELAERQSARIVKEATPEGGRGSGETPSTNADFWVAKGELPPDTPQNRELREQVVEQRIKIEENKSKFADRAVLE